MTRSSKSLRRAAGKMARKRSDLARKSSGVDGPDLNETYRESMAEAEAADAAPKPPRQNRPKPSCVGRVSGMKAWPQPYTNRVCVLVCVCVGKELAVLSVALMSVRTGDALVSF